MMISSRVSDEDEIIRWIPPSISPMTPLGKANASKDQSTSENSSQAARQEIEREIEKARLSGYQNGLVEGEARARDTASGEREELVQVLASLQSRLTQIDEDTQQALVHFAFELGKKVIRRELHTDQQFYLNLIQRTFEEIAKQSPPVSIKLHPEDVDLICDGASNDLSSIVPLLVRDESLPRGSCLFETPVSFIDVGIDSMIDRMAATHVLSVNNADVDK